MFPFAFILVFLVPRLAIASPGNIALRSGPLPPNVNQIAHDERTGNYLAYRDDGSFYGTLGPSEQAKISPRSKPKAQKVVGECYKMTKKEVESMKGWDKIKKHADEKWGTGSRRVVVNPKEHPGRGAVICSAGVTRVEFSKPSCVDSQEEDSGTFDEAKNTTRFIIERYLMFDARWVIDETSSFGPKLGFKTTIRIPKVYDSSRTLNSTMVVTNIKGAELNITARRDEYVDVEDAKKGEKCVAKVDVRTCDALGRGSFSPAARGWVWFIYDKPVRIAWGRIQYTAGEWV